MALEPQLILLDAPMAGPVNFEEKEDMARYIVISMKRRHGP